MKNFWLLRRKVPKIGDLVDWIDAGVVGPYSFMVTTYGEGPFRVFNRKYDFDDETFYLMLESMKQNRLKDWFASNMITKYDWGVGITSD